MLFPPRGKSRTKRLGNSIPAFALHLVVCLFAQAAGDSGWPLQLTDGATQITIQAPRYTHWDFLRLTMEAPVRVSPSGEAPLYATATLVARSYADRPSQSLLLREFSVAGLELSAETQRSATGDASPQAVAQRLGAALLPVIREVSLMDIVTAFAGKKRMPSVPISSDSPRIFAARTPSILLQFDGPPMWLPVVGTKLSLGVNTNWDIFYDNKSTFYYLLAGDLWLATHDIYAGEWVIPKSLPKEIKQVPHTPDFTMVWKNLPYKPNPDRAIPKVFFSEQAAELLLLDGEPVRQPIEGTDLEWVTNTASDLFYHRGEQRYYVSIAGRWFTSSELEGYWRPIASAPRFFAQVPAKHPKAHVLAHVSGTPQAEVEALWSLVPQLARVKRSEASLQIAFAGKPQYVPIDGTSLLWVPNATIPALSHAGVLYACHHAVWFRAERPEGPWVVADSLPEEIYRIPSRSAAFHLSFVRLLESDSETVTFGYTGGYKNTFVHEGTVVYGTGFSHPPALQYGAYTYPIYFAQPSTYGAGAWYSPQYHVFLRGRPGYGPYGGFGATSRYNSVTSHYFRPHGLYGADDPDLPELAFHPYTGLFGRVLISYEPYAVWGKAAIAWSRASAAGSPSVGNSNEVSDQAAKDGNEKASITIQVGPPSLSAPTSDNPAKGLQGPRKPKP